jgi:plastocyanin
MKRMILGVALVFGLLGVGDVLAATQQVNANFSSFSPENITINEGDSVRWVRVSNSHTTTSGSGPLDPESGDLWDAPLTTQSPQYIRRFNTPGFYEYYCKVHGASMSGTITVNGITGIFEDLDGASVTPRTALFQNVPNPFNASTLVGFSNRTAGHVELAIYNILGRRVRTLADGEYEPGARLIEWDGADENGQDVPSGVYFYRMSTREGSETRKLVLLR